MRVQNLILNAVLISAVSALVNVATAGRAAACSCFPASVESSYQHASDVAYVDVRRSFTSNTTRYYVGYVARTFKGCLRAGQRVILKTPVSSATCGSVLGFQRYLINGQRDGGFLGTPMLSINLCSYDRPAAELSERDVEFLNGRTVCCGGACSCADGSQPVQCLVDPCSVAPACTEGKCVANYCGGCNAEFYNERGEPVCEGPTACKSNEDCREGSYCASDKVCTEDGACGREVDCNLPGNDYAHIECVGHGICSADGMCGWQCKAPQCVDLAGFDIGPCDAVLGWGVIDASCRELSGCSAGDFELFASGEECRKECAAESCKDLSGVDFGPCKRLLGAGVIAGQCKEIGGCDSQGYTLFEDVERCKKACTP